MTDGDRQAFAAQLALLQEVYDRSISELAAEAYFAAMKDYALEDIADAIAMHVRNSKWLPRPAELIDCLREIRRAHRVAIEQSQRAELAAALPEDSPDAIAEARRKFADLVEGLARKYVTPPATRATLRPVSEMDAEVQGLNAINANDPAHRARIAAALGAYRDVVGEEALRRDQPESAENVRQLRRRAPRANKGTA